MKRSYRYFNTESDKKKHKIDCSIKPNLIALTLATSREPATPNVYAKHKRAIKEPLSVHNNKKLIVFLLFCIPKFKNKK